MEIVNYYPLAPHEVVGPHHYCGRKDSDEDPQPITNDKAIGLTANECRNAFVNYEFYSKGKPPIFAEFNFVGELFNEKKQN